MEQGLCGFSRIIKEVIPSGVLGHCRHDPKDRHQPIVSQCAPLDDQVFGQTSSRADKAVTRPGLGFSSSLRSTDPLFV